MHGCGELPAARPRWEPHGGRSTAWVPAASPEHGVTVCHPCTELCMASGGEQPPRVSLPPPSFSFLLTTIPRRPADGFHGVLFIHDLGEPKVTLEGHRGERCCHQAEVPLTPLMPQPPPRGPCQTHRF